MIDRPLTESETKIVRYWREVWTEGNLEAVADIYASSYRENLEALTPEEFVEGAAKWRAHFTNMRVDIDELLSIDNRVVSRVTYRGTHTGDFKRVPARGREIAHAGIDIFEFEDGFVVQHWHMTDHLEMFQQLGAQLVPPAD